MFDEISRPVRGVPLTRIFLALAVLLLLAAPGFAQSNPSGLVLPRFASTRSEPINVRVGPGQKYDIAWTFLQAGIPVEIIQEFDTWRKIRDVEGDEGWIHQNLLTGTRMGYVTALVGNGEIALRAGKSDDASVRARLASGFKVTIKQCDGDWCEVTASGRDENQRLGSYSGFLHQEELWGVYPGEDFD